IASGSLSLGGICTTDNLRPVGPLCWVGIVPVISLDDTGVAAGAAIAGGITTDARLSSAGEVLSDCRPIGVGEVIEGVPGEGVAGSCIAGLALSSAGGWAEGCGSLEFSIGGNGGGGGARGGGGPALVERGAHD